MNRFGFALGVAAVLAAPVVRAEGRVIPFTTWQAEQQAIVGDLPCKWVSVDGKYSGGRYDFLCKGGTWATVSLFLDKSSVANGVGGVRLHYIEWNQKVHPSGAEAFVAQKFLNFVVDRFVPSSAAPAALEAFWGERGRSWSGGGVEVAYRYEDGKDYGIHKLEISGVGRSLAGVGTIQASEMLNNAPARSLPATQEVTPSDAGLLKTPIAPAPAKDEKPGVPWTAVPTPPVKKIMWTSGTLPVAPAALPAPNGGDGTLRGKEIEVPHGLPAAEEDSSTMAKAKAALKQMLEAPEAPPLEQATPAELNTAPAPMEPVKPLPQISQTLVPSYHDLQSGRVKAPTSFDAYNKAEELTKELEKRAGTQVINPPKVKASDAAQQTLAPAPQPGPSVNATPTPNVTATPTLESRVSSTDAGLAGSGKPVRLSPEEMDNGGLGTYDPMNPARNKDIRPLPQLKFIPKAEPVRNPDENIKFEDEGSRL